MEEWLGSDPLVLFVDELNRRIPPDTVFEEEPLAKELADYVLQHFLNKRQRYFVFSSHVAALGNSLRRYYSSFSFRGVYKPQIPRVERISDVIESGICSGTHAGIVSWTGRAPGLLTLFYSNEPPQPDRVREPFIAMEAPRLDADLARDAIGAIDTVTYLSRAAGQLVPDAVDDGCKFGGVITAREPDTLKDLITEFHQKMDPTLAGERYVSYFVKPIYSTLHGFSFFVFVTEYGSLTTIYGGPCKEGATGPDRGSVDIIKRSLSEALASLAPDEGAARVYFRGTWLCRDGDQGQEVNFNKRLERDIGVVPSRAVIQEVIGVSPAQMCPFEWLVEGKDQAGGEGTVA
ncbi:unnamed protein product [Vitrella brassicaformis CCMP3155]|uniref:Uncharacterized protein n=1 Tax=Vitrella brassicaformis (strain CCMP3155) TaxID=1169540 RepID=A0A0G4FHD4_VITBC|nr:unnamed protein product [Vitrella brassicaformis CCMP3155]|eukprot:CEM12873.1 unnamed protein product [Vitrella brassicaformis CCMP3155]